MLGPDGRVRTWNAAARKLFGFSSADILGKPQSLLYCPEDVAAGMPERELARARQGFHERLGWRQRRDGSRFRASVVTAAIRDEDRRLVGYSCITRDLGERRAFDILQLSVDCSPNGILLVDHDARIALANAQIEKMLGCSHDEMIGLPAERLIPGLRPASPEARADGVAPNGAVGRDMHAVRLDGGTFPVEVRMKPIPTPAGWLTLANVVDITERKRTENELRKLNETLEQRVAERTRVAEQRISQLRALASRLTRAEQRDRVRLAQLLHDQIQQILVVAKMKTSMASRQPGDCPRLLEEVAALLQQTVESSRSLAIDLSPPILQDAGLSRSLHWLARRKQEQYGLTVEVIADPRDDPAAEDVKLLLFEAVRELLMNVIRHAGVSGAQVSLRRPVSGGWLQVQVSDKGAGFDPDAVREGTGLVELKERVELLGGTMLLQSEPGGGTCVSLTLPAAEPSSILTEESHAPEEPPALSRTVLPAAPTVPTIRVLVVDDHKIVRQGLVGLLQAQTDLLVVGEASNGEEAVERARFLRPDVIVMDVNMPVMNGIEATRRIKQSLRDVRIIGLSLYKEADMERTMLEAGASAYLTKDGPSENLIAAIRSSAAA